MRVAGVVIACELAATSIGCNGPGSSQSAPAAEAHPRYGLIMSEVGQRFERAGRAASAGRFDLAAYEVSELNELFSDDLPRAEPPKDGASASLPAMSDAFTRTALAPLKAAAGAHDLAAFRSAFKDAATSCNSCHQISLHPFIEVPAELDKPVPNLDPVKPAGSTP